MPTSLFLSCFECFLHFIIIFSLCIVITLNWNLQNWLISDTIDENFSKEKQFLINSIAECCWSERDQSTLNKRTQQTSQREMEFLGYHYYKLNRIFLLLLGLWPYGDSVFKRIHIIFFIFTILFLIIAQV